MVAVDDEKVGWFVSDEGEDGAAVRPRALKVKAKPLLPNTMPLDEDIVAVGLAIQVVCEFDRARVKTNKDARAEFRVSAGKC